MLVYRQVNWNCLVTRFHCLITVNLNSACTKQTDIFFTANKTYMCCVWIVSLSWVFNLKHGSSFHLHPILLEFTTNTFENSLSKNQSQIPIRSGIVKHFIRSLWLGWLRKHSLCLTLNLHLHFTFFFKPHKVSQVWDIKGVNFWGLEISFLVTETVNRIWFAQCFVQSTKKALVQNY